MSEILEHLQNKAVSQSMSAASDIKQKVRDFLIKRNFQEFDTPILIPETGEKYNAVFNVVLEGDKAMLADSPQIYKMMLALAGYEKYFQFAHCFRPVTHEDNIHTRLSEFIQIDVELKNTNFDDLSVLAEQLIVDICKVVRKVPKITYMEGLECRDKYGEEMKPDLREQKDDVSVVFIKYMPLTNSDGLPCHHIFAKPGNEIFENKIDKINNYTTESFDIIMNGLEIGGGDLRIMDAELQRRLMHMFDVDEDKYTAYLEMLEICKGNQGGGFAIGLERLIMALLNCENICQTAAFPNFYKRGRC